MKRLALGLALIFASATASAQQVEVASGDWSNIPTMERRNFSILQSNVLDRMHQLAASEACHVSGFSERRIDLSVPFMIQFNADGSIRRMVVRDLGCRDLEGVLAGVLLNMARAGEFRHSGANRTGWYRSEFSILSTS